MGKINQPLNLIDNTIKYSYPATVIRVEVVFEKSEVFILVKDEDQGISEEKQAMFFDSFRWTTVQPTGGESRTGLGLAIIKRL